MSRILAHPDLGAAATRLGAPPVALDDVARAAVDEAAARAYEQGRRDGREAAAAEAAARLDRAGDGLRTALGTAREELAALRHGEAEADVELALQVAAAVLGREPGPDATALAERLTTAIDRLDDEVAVHVHPDDAPTVTQLLATEHPGVTVTTDATLTPGEARVLGPFARARLTRDTALAAVRRELPGVHDA